MRHVLAVLALVLVGCGSASISDGDRGAQVRRYTIHSRLAGGDLGQVTIRPAHAGARPPLLVFLHGCGSAGASNANPQFLAALARRHLAVVLPDGGQASYWHDRAGGRFGSYVVREVIPTALRRLHADPRRVAIGGISMGGFGALDIARLHPGRFCAVGGHSAALWRTARETAPGAFDDATDFARHDVVRNFAPHRAAVWLDAGSTDPFRPGDSALAARLGVPLRTWPGGHEASYWHAHYADYLRFYARALARC